MIRTISRCDDKRKEDLRLDPHFLISMGGTKKELSLSAQLSDGLRAAPLPAGCCLTCRIPWQQISHLGDTMAVPTMTRLDLLSINLGGTKNGLGISLKLLCHRSPSTQLSDGLRAAAMTGCCLTSCPLWHQYCHQDSIIRGCKKQPRQNFAAASPIFNSHIRCKVKALPQRFKVVFLLLDYPLHSGPKLGFTAALPAPALPAGYWLTCRIPWHQQCHLGPIFRGCLKQPLQRFTAAPPLSNSMGGGTETMLWAAHYCTKACHLWDIMVVQSLRLPQFSLVARSSQGSGKSL